MARILIADNEVGTARLERVLSGVPHDIEAVTTFSDALSASANDGFDLIIIGVQFDDSQMYELMQAMKQNRKLKKTPVMGFCNTHTFMSRTNRDSCESGTHALGACDYVDTTGLSDVEICDRIDDCIAEQKGLGRKVTSTEKTPKQKRENQVRSRN